MPQLTVSELFKRDVIIASLHLTRCPTSCQALQKRQGNKTLIPARFFFTAVYLRYHCYIIYKLSILFMHCYFRPSFITDTWSTRGDVIAKCEFELNISEYLKSRSARKIEYNSVFSRYAEYRCIGLACIKLYFSGYAGVPEYRLIGEAEFKLNFGGCAGAEYRSIKRD